MRDVQYGINSVETPPPENNILAAKAYEASGYDFLVYWDQLCLTIPRSIWTPDLVPAANIFDIDDWLEPWPLMTAAAMSTERIRIGVTTTDVIRRPAAVLAQLALTIDHHAHGRFFMSLGAGEEKQCRPYGIKRERPFAVLEDTLKVIRLLWENDLPIDYDGPIWKLKDAILRLKPYEGRCPDLLVAGGPGKAMRFAAQLADGWITYFPPCGPPETYAEQLRQLDAHAEAVGKDPTSLTRMLLMMCVIQDTEEEVERAIRNAAIRWDVACAVPSAESWERFGRENPLGRDWAYARDLIPMEWAREDALKIVDQVPPDMVRNLRFCGTPLQVAEQVQPFIEAGATHVALLDYGSFVSSGDFGDQVAGSRRMLETYNHLRRFNGQPQKSAPEVGVG